MATYCTHAQVILGHPSLTVSHVSDVLDDIILESEDTVRADVSGFLDIESIDDDIDDGEDVPMQIERLAIYKSRELGYRTYYGTGRPENSEIDDFAKDYSLLLNDIREGRVQFGYRLYSEAENTLLFI